MFKQLSKKETRKQLKIAKIKRIVPLFEESDCSENNPLGGSLEHYDIERERDLLDKIEN